MLFHNIRCFLFLILLVGCFYAMPAQADLALPLSQDPKVWEKTLQSVDNSLAKETVDLENHSQWQDQLKQLKEQAQQAINGTQEELRKQKALLATLGVAPEEPQDEAEEVRADRKALNDTISTLDARIKQAKLTMAKADKLLGNIDSRKQAVLRNQLLAKDMSISELSLSGITQSAIMSHVEVYDAWWRLAIIMASIMAIIIVSRPVKTLLESLFEQAKAVRLTKSIKRYRLILLGVSALLVFLLRFQLITLDDVPNIAYMVRFSASIILSVILFIALGKIQFVAPEYDKNDLGEHKRSYLWIWSGLRNITRLVLLGVPFVVLAGYTNLGLYLTFNILASMTALMLFIFLRRLVVYVNKKLQHASAETSEKENQENNLSPLAITVIEPILAVLMLGFAGFFWGLTSDDVTTWIEQYEHGIPIGDITIDFASIGASLALFFILYLCTKIIQWFLTSRVFPYTNLNTGIRDAIIAITGYVGIIIALLAGMGALGLDLSNLAIVAGALSVGIGFGLQAIFSNFVSGLILLFERPVKVGDWVVVGENQGLIKKIRVRSTEIETFRNASVIVPNSQLISEVVTNWTLHDRVGRVDVAVGVAYGSDTEKVKEVLLKVASEHPQVRSHPQANVFFMNFGDSSLDFELRCFIRNIRDVFRVTSEIRFAVDAAFREHGIEIPFPQRDLHIVSSTPLDVKQDDK